MPPCPTGRGGIRRRAGPARRRRQPIGWRGPRPEPSCRGPTSSRSCVPLVETRWPEAAVCRRPPRERVRRPRARRRDVARPRLGPAAQPPRPGRRSSATSTRTSPSSCPTSFAGHPTRFATTWDPVVRHRVQVETARDLAVSRLGVDPTRDLTVGRLAVADGPGRPRGHRRARSSSTTRASWTAYGERLEWYPDDVWRHVVATDWARARARSCPSSAGRRERGDDLGSRVVAARLAGVAMHLGHLLERRWPPYAKWLGTSFAATAAGGRRALAPLQAGVAATDWRERESGLVEALRVLSRVQGDAGLPDRRTIRSSRSGTGPTAACARRRDVVLEAASPTRPCGRCRAASARPSSGATTSTC